MNKNDKSLKKLSLEIINSINFYFKEEENDIKYEEYAINGILINNFNINDISYNSVNISCSIEKSDIINNDNIEIEYILEMRKENKNEKFKQLIKNK